MRGFRRGAGSVATSGLVMVSASSLAWPAVGSAQDPSGVDTPFKEAPWPIIDALHEPLEDLPQVENVRLVVIR
jgi:hypothetical protein